MTLLTKKPFLILLVSFMFITVKAQVPKEAYTLTNSLSDLWYKGEIDKAIESSMELYRLYPPMFIERIHNTLAQFLEDEKARPNGIAYLKELYLKNNAGINKIITPIYLWSKVKQSKDTNEIKSIFVDLNNVIADSSDYKSQTERYCLLILKELESNNIIDKKTKEALLKKVINNLEAYPFISKGVKARKASEERAWNRYLLAYSYYYLYSRFDNKKENLFKASKYSPDANDLMVKYAYFYDAGLLTGNTHEVGYKKEYFIYLKKGNNSKEALNLLTEIAFNEPSDNNIKNLKSYFAELSADESFETYWFKYINQQSKSTPKVIVQFPTEKLDLTKKHDNWIYIDFWGTWCSPCVRELPELQAFFVENSNVPDSKLKIYTFSFASQNLASFMSENKYTFPVSEIEKQISDLFEVVGYPTKILITPEGNYLQIPFGADWKLYIKNYLLQ